MKITYKNKEFDVKLIDSNFCSEFGGKPSKLYSVNVTNSDSKYFKDYNISNIDPFNIIGIDITTSSNETLYDCVFIPSHKKNKFTLKLITFEK